jgi:hypothetical protein
LTVTRFRPTWPRCISLTRTKRRSVNLIDSVSCTCSRGIRPRNSIGSQTAPDRSVLAKR